MLRTISAARLVASWTALAFGLFAAVPTAVSQPAPRPATPAPAGTAGGAPAIVILGDSLSAGYGLRREEGWVTLLERRLRTEGYGYRVVNASVSGETTGGALARLPRILQVHRPAVVVVELGGNDGLRGVPVAEMRSNLERIVTLSKDAGARVLVAGMQIPTNYGPQYTRQFSAAFGEVAKRHGAALVPFFLEGVALDAKWFQPDGIHPTAAAQPYLLENVWPQLRTLLRTRAVARS